MNNINVTTVDMVNVTINGVPCRAPAGSTILEAAHAAGIAIPTLCYLKELNAIGACRICVVEIKGSKNLVAACVYPITEGMEVLTNTEQVQAARRTNLKLILSTHNQTCLTCHRSGLCELQRLCREYGVDNQMAFEGEKLHCEPDDSACHMVRDNSKCILCRRCEAVCSLAQGVHAIGASGRGFTTHIGPSFDLPLSQSACIHCGQCIIACPTGALHEKEHTSQVWAALGDPSKHVVVQTAPSVRAGLGEVFHLPIGTNVQGKMVAALRRLGFDGVFDTDFAADLTILEEATEFLHRVQSGGAMPLITSCCPGWVKYCETFFPDFIPNLSTCKSPQQMFGAMAKSYYAKQTGLDPRDIVVVSIMPCTAKKFEIGRENQCGAGEGIPDVDIALTTRELAEMIQRAGLLFSDLPEEEFDPALGIATGAAHIFGASGGVMEAALRTAAELLTGKELDQVEFQEVRGAHGVREAAYDIAGKAVRVCVLSGTANAGAILEDIRAGRRQYDFIEIMACPGGCVNGGGQPFQPPVIRNFKSVSSLRAKALYREDADMSLRKSHKSPLIQTVYRDFLGTPGSEIAHCLLHTSYVDRSHSPK
ncbi:MAG: NADH-dependent [FeFe] hydrogenase, group A6 [Lawsonibacter sp.]